mmetsp:Transcript_18059/g.25724  ORF Transcript_18059/g.25724 Transcript_18059/m.25724 type:complete len:80 (-) Transcript_18059:799-1038(-)
MLLFHHQQIKVFLYTLEVNVAKNIAVILTTFTSFFPRKSNGGESTLAYFSIVHIVDNRIVSTSLNPHRFGRYALRCSIF